MMTWSAGAKRTASRRIDELISPASTMPQPIAAAASPLAPAAMGRRPGALIAADHGGPHDDPPGVHKNRAGRLAGQANSSSLATGSARHLGQHSLRRAPPFGGILLEPAGWPAIGGVLGGGRRVDGARLIDGDRRGPRRPAVETEKHYPAEVGGTASCCDQ